MPSSTGSEENSDRSFAGLSERIISAAGGAWLLYDMIAGRKPHFLKSAAAGFLLFRGATGYGLISGGRKGNRGSVRIETTLTVNRPVEEVYSGWRKLENLPRFMVHLEQVHEEDERNSEWTARIPGGAGTFSWKSEIIREEPNVQISWRSLPGSTVENEGTVSFHDAGRFGTRVEAIISYRTPAGAVGDTAAQWAGPVLEKMVRRDIRNFKAYLETGEVPTGRGQADGRH